MIGVTMELLQGAKLLLLHNRRRSERGGDEEQDGGDQAGNDEVHALQFGIIPDAHAPIHNRHGRHDDAQTADAIGDDVRRITLDNALGVAEDHLCGVGVGTIIEGLHSRRATTGKVFSEIARDGQYKLRFPGQQQLVDFIRAGQVVIIVEIARVDEALDKLAAGRGAILIKDRGGDVCNIIANRIAEQQELEDRGDENERHHPPIARGLNQLLFNDLPDTPPFHR